MKCSIMRITACFLLFVCCAKSAPAHHGARDLCAAVRSSALSFNNETRNAYKTRMEGEANVTSTLAWMEAQDQCDPRSLKLSPKPCIEKMLDVLRSYRTVVGVVADFKNCSGVTDVKPKLEELYEDMSRCVMSRVPDYQPKDYISQLELHSSDDWEEQLLCKYTVERLFSFSILTARVFSVGDPANHAEPTETADSTKCA